MSDLTKAPTIAKQSLARAGNVFRAKPAAAAVDPPIPKGPLYRLLPPYTVRRFLRPKVRLLSGKRSMFAHPIRCIRPEVYKPLPEGWVWPPIPTQSDLPYIPRRKNGNVEFRSLSWMSGGGFAPLLFSGRPTPATRYVAPVALCCAIARG